MKEDKKKVFIKTFGCQMNVRDSEVICGLLTKGGCQLADRPEEAEVIILNTCAVREHAEDKVWSEIGRVVKMGTVPVRGQSPFLPIIGVVGCMAQSYKEEIFRRAPQVDFVVGPSDIAKIPQIISKLSQKKGTVPCGDSPLFLLKLWETDGVERPQEVYHTGFHQDKSHAFVVISEGCENFCSYCVVPYTRGPLRHRNYKDILSEIEEAVDKGITNITLLGQNVCAYGAGNRGQGSRVKGQGSKDREGVNFIRLLEMVERIKGLKEFSFLTSHPKDASIELFRAMADCQKLKKCLHLPVQSGSDRVLKAMNRGYSARLYLDLADSYRKIVSSGALTTDIIVGFPGETKEEFQQTLELVKRVEFNAAYIFKYSPRPHTQAALLPDDVSRQEKEERHRLILDLQKAISNKLKV